MSHRLDTSTNLAQRMINGFHDTSISLVLSGVALAGTFLPPLPPFLKNLSRAACGIPKEVSRIKKCTKPDVLWVGMTPSYLPTAMKFDCVKWIGE